MLRSMVLAGLLAASWPAWADDAAFDRLVDAYYAERPAVYPTQATGLGLHGHDGDLDDLSQAAVAREVARLGRWRARFAVVDQKALSRARAADLLQVRAAIDGELLERTRIQRWRHRPDVYSGLAARSVYVLIKREFAPAQERLRAVIARERKIPTLLAQGQKNLTGVARIAVEITLDQLPGTIAFFQRDVPLAFAAVGDATLQAELAAATAQVTTALEGYGAFLRRDLLPQANAPFAIGEELFRKKLLYDEMIETPLDELLQRGEAELKRLQAEFRAVAAKIDPKRPALEVLDALQKDHEPADKLLAATQARLAGLRQFLVDKQIVTVPSEVMPKVQETPPFSRATTIASMETPGPFETRATEAYYNVTLPDPSWPAAKAEDFLRGAFARMVVDLVSIHEAFPGHYVQFLWLPRVKSKVRKFEGAASNSEGWAHYCEQMLLDEGYGGGDARLRLAQLQEALLRAARYVVGIRMHTRGMSFDEAVELFQKEGFQSKQVAFVEARRGTGNPTYLYYTLGKLELLKLREDYKKKLGAAYSLRKFHDAFLAEGPLPLPLVRRALLGD